MRKSAYIIAFFSMFGLADLHRRTRITLENCGRTTMRMERIVGGDKVAHGEYPWMISIHENFKHVCGGAILNEHWIISAAHCFDYPKKPWRYRIYAGLHQMSKKGDDKVKKHKVSDIIIHKDYDSKTFENDIALIRTKVPIDFTEGEGYINGICLPLTDKDPKGYATVTGWGHTTEGGKNSNTMKTAQLPIVPRDVCNEAYDEDPDDDDDEVTEMMICAGEVGQDSCQNDSGGPLIQNMKGTFVLIGIVSYGAGCGDEYPGVYTKVAAYRDWIEENMD